MKNILYVLSKSVRDSKDYESVLFQDHASTHITVVHIGKAIGQENVLANQAYYVTEENEGGSHDSISYRDMLNLVFACNNSIVV